MPKITGVHVAADADNIMINGNFDIWQRGTSFSGVSGINYATDKWRNNSATGSYDYSRSVDVPNNRSTYSMEITVNSAADLSGTGKFTGVNHVIEGHQYAKIAGKQATLSFWVKNSVVGTYTILLFNGSSNGQDLRQTKTYTIDQADTWEKKELVFFADDRAGEWSFDSNAGLQVYFSFGSSSDLVAAQDDVWAFQGITESPLATNTFAATPGATLNIAQVQLHEGVGSLPYRTSGKTIQDELAACQRYFQLLGSGMHGAFGDTSQNTAAFVFEPKVPLRAAPTVTIQGSIQIRYHAAGNGLTGAFTPNNATIDTSGIDIVIGFSTGVGFGATQNRNYCRCEVGGGGDIWVTADF